MDSNLFGGDVSGGTMAMALVDISHQNHFTIVLFCFDMVKCMSLYLVKRNSSALVKHGKMKSLSNKTNK